MKPIPVVVGFDQREAVAYHVFCQSVLEKASRPVQFMPLAINALKFYTETHRWQQPLHLLALFDALPVRI
jgi:hypothetical protein